jgi:hypothetical protein
MKKCVLELLNEIGKDNRRKVAEILTKKQDDFIKKIYDEIKTEHGETSPDGIRDEIERERAFAVIDTCNEIFGGLLTMFEN